MRGLVSLLGLGIVCIVAMQGSTVSAHVLVMDEEKSAGAILHVIPDDDPVAGKKSTLFFDIQDKIVANGSAVTLTITPQYGGEREFVKTTIAGSLVTAEYIFPSQGVYEIRYTVKTDSDYYVFVDSMRISRGVALAKFDESRHIWAEAILLACAVAAVLCMIIAWNRRDAIVAQSKF